MGYLKKTIRQNIPDGGQKERSYATINKKTSHRELCNSHGSLTSTSTFGCGSQIHGPLSPHWYRIVCTIRIVSYPHTLTVLVSVGSRGIVVMAAYRQSRQDEALIRSTPDGSDGLRYGCSAPYRSDPSRNQRDASLAV